MLRENLAILHVPLLSLALPEREGGRTFLSVASDILRAKPEMKTQLIALKYAENVHSSPCCFRCLSIQVEQQLRRFPWGSLGGFVDLPLGQIRVNELAQHIRQAARQSGRRLGSWLSRRGSPSKIMENSCTAPIESICSFLMSAIYK